MTDIFISYSRKDVAVASDLARTLEELGYSVWWDMDGLHGGQPFANVIQEKLSEAKCAIVLWSPDAVLSTWVHSEASFADDRGILVTAVCREAHAPMPFNNRHNESLRGWNGSIFDDGFQKLLKAINRHCPEPLGRSRVSEAADDKPEQDVTSRDSEEEIAHPEKFISKTEPKKVELGGFKLPSLHKSILFVVVVAATSSFLSPQVRSFVGSVLLKENAASDVTTSGFAEEQHEDQKLPASNKIYNLPSDLTLLLIPIGSFMLGNNNEKPVQTATFAKPFWMSKTEITFDQYDRYAKATGKKLPYDEGWGRGTRPVINVSWNDAQGYVKWLSSNNQQGLECRLPSEAEWEYAARAGAMTKYSWGNKASHEYANYGEEGKYGGLAEGHDKWVNTAPVASFPSNQWGIHDMHGNVWEWVQDRYHADDKGVSGKHRVIRGGSWGNSSSLILSTSRSKSLPDSVASTKGFRIVCSSRT